MLNANRTAQGGPQEELSTGRHGELDPRFERLGLSLARMDALERGLTAIPQVMPADMRMISSGFGYRSDPLVGMRAMHEGMDFNAETGTPVVVAADGVVFSAAYHAEFGNLIEVDHGEGLLSRYAHLSRMDVRVGQLLRRGDLIGAIGSTGRSTGPHLHFEVRQQGVAQNPARFLKQGEDYAQLKRR